MGRQYKLADIFYLIAGRNIAGQFIGNMSCNILIEGVKKLFGNTFQRGRVRDEQQYELSKAVQTDQRVYPLHGESSCCTFHEGDE